jgi:hypothetical protein
MTFLDPQAADRAADVTRSDDADTRRGAALAPQARRL